jgi:hypothetical protein
MPIALMFSLCSCVNKMPFFFMLYILIVCFGYSPSICASLTKNAVGRNITHHSQWNTLISQIDNTPPRYIVHE